MQRKVMPCNCQGETRTTPPPNKFRRGAHVPSGYNLRKKTQAKTNLRYLVDVTSAGHNDRALNPTSKPNLERKNEQNFQGSFSDQVLHRSGLEFRKATQGREGVGKGWG
jgi:hypothetical protein